MDIQQLTNAMDAYGGNVAGTTSETAQRRGRTSNSATSAQGDTVQVSQDGQLLNVARKAAQEAPDVRAEKVEQLKNGMTRNEVRNLLGSPSSVVTLDRDTWIYMSSEIEQIAFMRPEEIDRQLLVVKFNTDGKVANIEHLDQSEGKQLAVSEQKTNAPEQEQGFFRKYFGGVGQISPFGSSGNIDE